MQYLHISLFLFHIRKINLKENSNPTKLYIFRWIYRCLVDHNIYYVIIYVIYNIILYNIYNIYDYLPKGFLSSWDYPLEFHFTCLFAKLNDRRKTEFTILPFKFTHSGVALGYISYLSSKLFCRYDFAIISPQLIVQVLFDHFISKQADLKSSWYLIIFSTLQKRGNKEVFTDDK